MQAENVHRRYRHTTIKLYSHEISRLHHSLECNLHLTVVFDRSLRRVVCSRSHSQTLLDSCAGLHDNGPGLICQEVILQRPLCD